MSNPHTIHELIAECVAEASPETQQKLQDAMDDYRLEYPRTWTGLMRIPFVRKLFREIERAVCEWELNP